MNYNCFNEPFAASQYWILNWDMHGLIIETSIWLLAGSTRLFMSSLKCRHPQVAASARQDHIMVSASTRALLVRSKYKFRNTWRLHSPINIMYLFALRDKHSVPIYLNGVWLTYCGHSLVVFQNIQSNSQTKTEVTYRSPQRWIWICRGRRYPNSTWPYNCTWYPFGVQIMRKPPVSCPKRHRLTRLPPPDLPNSLYITKQCSRVLGVCVLFFDLWVWMS